MNYVAASAFKAALRERRRRPCLSEGTTLTSISSPSEQISSTLSIFLQPSLKCEPNLHVPVEFSTNAPNLSIRFTLPKVEFFRLLVLL